MRKALVHAFLLRSFHPRGFTTTRCIREPKVLPPGELLRRRVGILTRDGDAEAAAAAMREYVSSQLRLPPENRGEPSLVAFWEALSTTLFACEQRGKERLGLDLITTVRRHVPDAYWKKEENVLALTLRLHCATGEGTAAMHLFSYLVQEGMLKRRTASAFLRFCCRQGGFKAETQRDRVFAVYETCLRRQIELTGEDYVALGRFCVSIHEPLSTLHRMLSRMQESIPEVSEAMVREVLEPWCAQAAKEGARCRLRRVRIPPPTSTAVTCVSCQRPFKGYPFSEPERAALLRELRETVIPPRCRHPKAREGFETWCRYLAQRASAADPIDLFIDGANVGYYGLSGWYEAAKRRRLGSRAISTSVFPAKDLDFHPQRRSRAAVDVPVDLGLIQDALTGARATEGFRRPLVVLQEWQVAASPAEGQRRLAEWRRQGWLYVLPRGLNDDLCWLYGALARTTPTDARDAVAERHPPGVPPRESVYVLTNDRMRDHHFALLSPRAFTRWRERHRISFRCVREAGRTRLCWRWPLPYTRCLQFDREVGVWHLPYTLDKGEEAEEGGASPSHPVDPSGGEEPEPWVCLQLNCESCYL
ncbi:unnamed protein product [Phytomonas sp. EM1]|nr:unnamed protein product [Phytomonas sp. EM1]|eukprot:CCW60868.1 unnamed protein product [Phytomonas sp. isolate EM1]